MRSIGLFGLTILQLIGAVQLSGQESLGARKLPLIDSSKAIILVGEIHYSNGNDGLQFEVFKQLVEEQNVRVLLLECGMGSAYVIDKYLRSGRRELWFLEPYYTTERFFLDSLRQFQNRLMPNEQFSVAGIDYEKNLSALLWSLQDLLRECNFVDSMSPLSEESQSFFQSFSEDNNIEFKSRRKSKRYLDSLLVQFDINRTFLQYRLARKFELFQRMLNNYQSSKPLYGQNFENSNCPVAELRELLIYKNAMDLHSDKRMFGQFGMLHVCKEKQQQWWNKKNGWYSFSAMLNCEPDSKYRNKVCCMELLYPRFDARHYWNYYEPFGLSKLELQSAFLKCSAGVWQVVEPNGVKFRFDYLIVQKME